jgi:copper transport protein
VLSAAVFPAAAGAHAAFQDASPEPGAQVSRAPAEITLAFTEPLSRGLTTARVIDARSGRAVAATVRVESSGRLLVRPARPLATGAFRVDWHTVSARDGHALEGSFGFGVRTPAVGGEQQLEQSPLARDGWLRVALRSLLYTAVFFFGGGLLCGVLLSRKAPERWLQVGDAAIALRLPEAEQARRIRRRTMAAGWVAVAAAVSVAAAETYDAAQSLSWRAIDSYLLSTAAGGARALAALGLLIAVVLASRASRLAAMALLATLAAVAVGGHANSASPRALAVIFDWLHVVAAVVWAGGLAQIVATWLPGVRRLPADDRRLVMRTVLARFGRIAMPAAAVVVAAGIVNALIELGEPRQLWESSYGRVLMVKIVLVLAIVIASYVHALRLRPRLVADQDTWSAAEARHWRLLRAEPALAVAVVTAAALLAAFPLPPRQLLERAEADTPAPAEAAVEPAPRGDLAVAEAAGPWIAAVTVHPDRGSAVGTLRLLDFHVKPVAAKMRIDGARTRSCGRGCMKFRLPGAVAALRVVARFHGRVHAASIPISWDPRGSARARAILRSAVKAVDRLRSLRIAERLTSGLGGGAAVSHYRVDGRSRYSIVSRNGGARGVVAIGRRVWIRNPGGWQKQTSSPADRHDLLPWWTHRVGVRLLGIDAHTADIALADVPSVGIRTLPFWFRLKVDLATMRVKSMRMIAPGHFMDQRYFAFNQPVRIVPPPISP